MGHVSVVTGGGSGLGEAICADLGRAGHQVAVLDVDARAAGKVADELRRNGANSLAVEVDVSDPAGVAEAFNTVRDRLGPVQILVTSAAVADFTPFAKITYEEWNRYVAVNLTGTFMCVQAALPDMTAAGWGRIITISSASGQTGVRHQGHYSATKGGVIRPNEDRRLRIRRQGSHRQLGLTVHGRYPDAARGADR